MALSKLEQAALNRLPEIVAATGTGSMSYGEEFDLAYLIENGLIEIKDRNPDNNEQIAFVATQKAFDQVGVLNIPANVPNSKGNENMTTAAPKFELETGIEVPKATRTGGTGRESQYASTFAAMEVGHSFFVPSVTKTVQAKNEDGSKKVDGEGKPVMETITTDPVASLASTVAMATKKHDVPDIDEATGIQKSKVITVPKTGEKRTVPAMKHTKKFVIRPAEKDGVKGGRIHRVS